MEDLIKAIEDWYDGLALIVRNNSKVIKENLLQRAKNINNLEDMHSPSIPRQNN